MSLATSFRIGILKSRARRLYLQVHHRSDISCGAHLTDFIRPDVTKAIDEFNTVMAELATLDPAARAVLEKEGKMR